MVAYDKASRRFATQPPFGTVGPPNRSLAIGQLDHPRETDRPSRVTWPRASLLDPPQEVQHALSVNLFGAQMKLLDTVGIRQEIGLLVFAFAQAADEVPPANFTGNKQAAVEIDDFHRLGVVDDPLLDFQPAVGSAADGHLEIDVSQADAV